MKPRTRLQYENSKVWEHGPAHMTTFGWTWQRWSRAVNAMCPDGQRRTIKLSPEADTFFSIPGHVSFAGTTVTGFVTTDESDIYFSPCSPEWAARKMGRTGEAYIK